MSNYEKLECDNETKTCMLMPPENTANDKTKAFDNAAHSKVVWDALDACNATL